jgi:hypothetical protein
MDACVSIAAQATAEVSAAQDSFYEYHVTVFNPDGTSYSVAADTETLVSEPILLALTTPPLPDQVTIFEPDGTVHSHQFAQFDFVPLEPLYYIATVTDDLPTLTITTVQTDEPIIVSAADEDVWFGNVVWLTNADEDREPPHVAIGADSERSV